MAVTLTIGGVPWAFKAGSLSISKTANGHATAQFTLKSDGSTRPTLNQEVIITKDSARIFGGLVDRPTENGVVSGYRADIFTKVSAVDFAAYANRRFVVGTFTTGTLKQLLTALVGYLTPYGVSLDAAQVDGPDMPDLTYDYRVLADVLTEWATVTASFGDPFVWRIDDFKVLSMYQPSTVAAPFDILTDAPPQVSGDVEVEPTNDGHANRVIVRVPTREEVQHTEEFVGDGTTATFTLQFALLAHNGYVTSDGVFETLTNTGAGVATWTYDPGTNTITRTTAPGVGVISSIVFHGSFTGLGIAFDQDDIDDNGLTEIVVEVETVPSNESAQALADAYLARSLPFRKTVKYRTLVDGLEVGQLQTITVPRRALDDVAVITDIVIRDMVAVRLAYDVTLSVDPGQTNLGRNWRDTYRQWLGGSAVGTGAAIALGTGAPGSQIVRFTIRKGVDTARPSSPTLTDDPHLQFAMEADAAYTWECMVQLTAANGAMDAQIGVSVPSGAVSLWGAEGSNAQWEPVGTGGAPTQLLSNSGVVIFGTSGSGAPDPRGIVLKGTVQCGATPGNFAIRWAQFTSDPGDLTFLANSNLWYEPLRNP